jgi:hypothetical protein
MGAVREVRQGTYLGRVNAIEIVQTLQRNQAVANRLGKPGQDLDGIETSSSCATRSEFFPGCFWRCGRVQHAAVFARNL